MRQKAMRRHLQSRLFSFETKLSFYSRTQGKGGGGREILCTLWRLLGAHLERLVSQCKTVPAAPPRKTNMAPISSYSSALVLGCHLFSLERTRFNLVDVIKEIWRKLPALLLSPSNKHVSTWVNSGLHRPLLFQPRVPLVRWLGRRWRRLGITHTSHMLSNRSRPVWPPKKRLFYSLKLLPRNAQRKNCFLVSDTFRVRKTAWICKPVN